MGQRTTKMILAAALALALAGCGAQADSQPESGLQAATRAQGTVVVTQYPVMFEGYEHFGAITDGWAFVYKDGEAGYRASGGEYKPLYAASEELILQGYDGPADGSDIWQEMDWLAETYPYLPEETLAPCYSGGLWGFSDLDLNPKLEPQFATVGELWQYYRSQLPAEETPPADHTPPEGVEEYWPNPEGDGVYVPVEGKIRLYDASGKEQPSKAMARLTLQTGEDGASTLTITDQDGKQLLQLTSSQPDPMHPERQVCFDGDWFYWKTDEGAILPVQITVE